MSGPYPSTDSRRKPELLQQLEAIAPRFLAHWRGLTEPGDPGHALLQLGADLAEHVTRQHDGTSERDLKAFLNWLDLPGSLPTPAEAELVFTLSDKRDSAVNVNERIQVGATGPDGDEIIFETSDETPLSLTPARIEKVFSVDPRIDRIEAAPPDFVSLEPLQTTDPPYRLLSFASAGAEQVQITPPVGLEKNDWVRVDGAVYEITDEKDGIYAIDPKLDADVATETPVSRVSRFDLSTMRDLQRHVFYLGHKELLNVEQRAVFDLCFDPASTLDQLAGLDISWELWGKLQDGEADWQPLEATVGTTSIRLRKPWIGKAVEREVGSEKSRWLRARLRAPMVGGRPTVSCDRIYLQISSENSPVPADAPLTVTRAFHNATPLPLPGPFLPFGPEPRLFDQFYFAAPEALSKKGAKATFDIALGDATIGSASVALGTSTEVVVYAASTNGHLHVLRAAETEEVIWHDLLYPGNAAQAPENGDPTIAAYFDQKRQPAAITLQTGSESGPTQFVVAGDRLGRFWSTVVTLEPGPGKSASAAPWIDTGFPARAIASRDIVVLPHAPSVDESDAAVLITADQDGLWLARVRNNGQIKGGWPSEALESANAPEPQFTDKTRIVAVQSDAWPTPPNTCPYEILVIDESGNSWFGAVEHHQVTWFKIAGGAGTSARPTALRTRTELRAVHVDETGNHIVVQVVPGTGTASTEKSQTLSIRPNAVISSKIQTLDKGASAFLSVVPLAGSGAPSVALLNAASTIDTVEAPGTVTSGAPVATWLISTDLQARLYISGGSETTHSRTISEGKISVDTFEDALILDDQPEPATHVDLRHGTDEARLVKLAGVSFHHPDADRHIYAVSRSHGLVTGAGYKFLRIVEEVSPPYHGTFAAADRTKLTLDVNDQTTQQGHYLIIKNCVYEILSISNRVATLEPEVGGKDPDLDYLVAEELGVGTVEAKDLGAIAEVQAATSDVNLAQIEKLVLSDAAHPSIRRILNSTDPAVPPFRVLLDDAWTGAVPTGSISVLGYGSEIQSDWDTTSFPRTYDNPELSWEYYDGRGWRSLDDGFLDSTGHFIVTGRIEFLIPDDLQVTTIGGQDDYWIRARLIGGDYGQPIYNIKSEPVSHSSPQLFNQEITVDRSQLNPPNILSIDASYALSQTVAPELTLSDNNLALIDQTAAAEARGAILDLFAAAATLDPEITEPALYLGLSKPYSARALRLLVDAEEQEGDVRLIWEAFAGGQWLEVSSKDETHGLLVPGIVKLNVGLKPTMFARFGQTAFWLRARPVNASAWAPKLNGIYLNAAKAEQAETIRQELLGSTTGAPGETFRLANLPILSGSVELRVREQLGSEEAATLVATHGEDSIKSDVPEVPGTWVRWRETESFVEAEADARVFSLDQRTGEVRFGDGQHGGIPPAGTDNVRTFEYQAGGGQLGNVAAHSVTSLKSSVTGVEAVTNPLPARNGSDGRDVDSSCAQATARVRHVNRAIATRDIEAITLDFSPDIVRARCIRPDEPDAPITVVIAVSGASSERMPQPSIAVREGLAQFLADKATSSWPEAKIHPTGPEFVPLRLRLELILASSSPVSLPSQVRKRLFDLLHPIEGGHDGKGWPFGTGLRASDVHRALVGLLGDARITGLEIVRADDGGAADTIGPTALITALDEQQDIRVDVPETVT